MSENGGFLDVRYDNLLSYRGLNARPHPLQTVFAGILVATHFEGTELSALYEAHACACWKCRPELTPVDRELDAQTITIRRESLVPRFWKVTLDEKPCCFVKEAHPGYVWLARTPVHACACGSGYSCTLMLHGNVTVMPDGDRD